MAGNSCIQATRLGWEDLVLHNLAIVYLLLTLACCVYLYIFSNYLVAGAFVLTQVHFFLGFYVKRIYSFLLYHYMLIKIFLQFDWIKQAS